MGVGAGALMVGMTSTAFAQEEPPAILTRQPAAQDNRLGVPKVQIPIGLRREPRRNHRPIPRRAPLARFDIQIDDLLNKMA